MAEQERIAKPRKKVAKTDTPETEVAPPTQDRKTPEELKAELDALLDDIDQVLASNDLVDATQFIQKGGQ